MNDVVSWIAHFLAALLFMAVVVAWWEHVGRVERRRGTHTDLDGPQAPGRKVVSVDVDLDATATSVVLASDAATRRDVLDGAMSRMSRDGSTAANRSAWIDTAPMIGQGMGTAEPAPSEPQSENAR